MQLSNHQLFIMKSKFNIALVGGRGYVGQEIIGILNNHPNFSLSKIFSKSASGDAVKEYTKISGLKYSYLDKPAKITLSNIDIVILALPNNQSHEYVKKIEEYNSNIIIIDLSADHRFDKNWTYSIPEMCKPAKKNKISNPGCYASAIQFSLFPITKIIHGKVSCMGVSGYSGAGATPNDKNNLENLKDNIIPYSLSGHLHEDEVIKHCYNNLTFTPHVGNFFRGILITSHIQLDSKYTGSDIYEIYKDYYTNYELIKVSKEIPMINKIANSHFVNIGGFDMDESGSSLVVCCTLDNLLKGAATQVIQNLNYACNLQGLTGIHYE
jgi:N-acetyl-gamma-glutamyl-phosphate reductase common form